MTSRRPRSRHPLRRAALAAAAACTAATTVVACGDGGSSGDTPLVVAAFFPIADLVHQLDLDVPVEVMVPPGVEAHDYELTPKQLTRLSSAKVVFYLGNGFQPGVEEAVAALPSEVVKVDLLDSVTLLPVTDPLAGTEGSTGGETLADGADPHVWLDPRNMAAMAATVADTLADAGVVSKGEANAGAARATATYDALATRFHDGLAQCRSREIVTTHRAFGYLAHAFDLEQVSIAGISPAEEPSAKTLEAVARFVEDHGVTTIFSEENLPPDLARTVAEETGATTATLDTLETLSQPQLDAGDDYLSVMDANLAALRTALGCS